MDDEDDRRTLAWEDDRRTLAWIEIVRHGSVAEVEALLDAGLGVDEPDRAGGSPLKQAVCWGRIDVVRLLLDRGADPNLRPDSDYSPTTHAAAAARNGRGEALELLTAAGGRLDELPDAVWTGDVELARKLLDEGADVDLGKWSYDGTMLQVASLYGDLPMVELFLSRGADVEATDDLGQTPLMVAREHGRDEVVRLLLAHGAIDRRDDDSDR